MVSVEKNVEKKAVQHQQPGRSSKTAAVAVIKTHPSQPVCPQVVREEPPAIHIVSEPCQAGGTSETQVRLL